MVSKDYQKIKGSTKAEVGEIDTSAPFQSVKDAVSLFGEGAFSGEKPAIRKPKPQSAERVLAKETQLHLAQRELNKLKEQLKNAESTKAQVLSELERAKQTVDDLTQKLKCINESKNSAIMAAEDATKKAKQFTETNNEHSVGIDESLNTDLESNRAQYSTVVAELDLVKQVLRKIHQDYDASLEAKEIAAKQATEAETMTGANRERVGELSNEIASVRDSIEEVKLATAQAKEDEVKICAVKDKEKQSYKARLQESETKLLDLKKSINPQLKKDLESQLSETVSEIEVLKNKLDNARAEDVNSVKNVASELEGAKESLHKLVGDENSLRSQVEALKVELEEIKKEHAELKEKEMETESLVGNLHVKLRKAKSELEQALADQAKVRGASDEMLATIHQLALESENAKHEAEEMTKQAEALRKEAETAKNELDEAENVLAVALHEAEEATAAETQALEQIKMLSEKTDAARTSGLEPGSQITISRDEFESLSRKVEESEKLAEMKVAAAMAQVEAVKASENEALKRWEASQKEIEDIKAATQEALKKADMSEAAKKAVEGELRRWRKREQKKTAEAASRILAETEKSFDSSPHSYPIQNQNPQKKVMETRKLEKAKTSVAKKVLMPTLSGVFHKKKNQVDGGSPSLLPGERSVW